LKPTQNHITQPKTLASLQAKEPVSSIKVLAPGGAMEQAADKMSDWVTEQTENHQSIFHKESVAVPHTLRSYINSTATTSHASLLSKLASSKLLEGQHKGHPLPDRSREFLESSFSADFSEVRIHTDQESDDLNKALGAEAFTYGKHIYFRSNQYQPNSKEGMSLLAHELTHVIQQQQANAPLGIQRRMLPSATVTQNRGVSLDERTQALLHKLNAQNSAIRYRVFLPRIVYSIRDQQKLTEFDRAIMQLIDQGGVFYVKITDLISSPSFFNRPEGEADPLSLENLLALNNEQFQFQLLQFLGTSIPQPEQQERVALEKLSDGASPTLETGLVVRGYAVQEVVEGETPTEPSTTPEGEQQDQQIKAEGAGAGDQEVVAGQEENLVLLSPEPIMPTPPTELSEANKQRLSKSQAAARKTSKSSRRLPGEEVLTQEAQAGVTEPTEETRARVGSELTKELKQRPQPSPQIEELCKNIERAIRHRRPPDEDSLLEADPKGAADEVGNQLNESISNDTENINKQYDPLDNPPAGEKQQIGVAPELPPDRFKQEEINASEAAPDPIEISLEEDVENTQAAMEKAGMVTEVTSEINDPSNPIVSSRDAHGELKKTSDEDTKAAIAKQDEILASSQANMQDLQAQALEALQQSRSSTIKGGGSQQVNMVGTEEQKRAAVGNRAEEIFKGAQKNVNNLLQPLTKNAMDKWRAGKEKESIKFKAHLAKVQSWVDERHSGIGGAFLGALDYVTGLPGWVTTHYNRAEKAFGDGICDLIREISREVNSVIAACEQLIDNAETEISNLFDKASDELGDWALQQKERFAGRLDGLRNKVHETQENFNRDLANQAAQAVQEVREEVHALREAAKGLIGKIAEAVAAFIEDPLKFIIEGLLKLVGIEPASFWSLVNKIKQAISDIANDPIGFGVNLLSAIGQGFQQFFDNFATHLLGGLLDWLFSGLGAMGIMIPTDFSLSSIVTFFLQLMGFTWEKIREMLVDFIGPQYVEWIEQAINFMTTLIEQGPAGILELIKDQLQPQKILDMILETAKNFLVEAIATQVAIKVATLFVPGGVIVEAVRAIYSVLKWVFQNAAKIFRLIETIVNGIAKIIAGDISGMASAIELALRFLLTAVINFLANYFSLGALPEKVADTVRTMKDWVSNMIRSALKWVSNQAKNLLGRLGIGTRGERKKDSEGNSATLEDSEVGKTIRFSAEGEAHQIWIREEGTGVEVMMRSKEMAVGEKLDQWDGQVGQLPDDKIGEGKSLLSKGRSQYEKVKKEGAEAKEEIDEAKSNPEPKEIEEAEKADQEVEHAEEGLKNIIVNLFKVFGSAETTALMEQFDAEIKLLHPAVLIKVLGAFQDNPEEYIGKDWENVKAELTGDVLFEENKRPMNKGHEYGNVINDRHAPIALTKAVESTGRKPPDENYEEFIARRHGAIHGAQQATPKQVLETLQSQLFNAGNKNLVIENLKSFYSNSLTGNSLHNKFMPIDIEELDGGKNGDKILKYHYNEGDQQFSVRINDNGYPKRIEGENLTLHDLGRGITQDSDGKLTNAGMDSAHLIANMFGGSGYKKAQNIVATSSYYNRKVMYQKEHSLLQMIENQGKKVAYFNLKVSIKYADQNTKIELDAIRKKITEIGKKEDQKFVAMSDKDLLNEITSVLSKTDQPRIAKVTYTLKIFDFEDQVLDFAISSIREPDILFGLSLK
jgi:hypothetical protein